MELLPPLLTEQDTMLVMMIRKFVDKEIMPVRDRIDDDHDHVLVNEILGKMTALGVFEVKIRDKAPSKGSVVTNMAMAEELRGNGGRVLIY